MDVYSGLSYRVNLEYPGVMGHGDIDELGDKLLWRRLPHEKPYLLESVGNPREQYNKCDDNGSRGVREPGATVIPDD